MSKKKEKQKLFNSLSEVDSVLYKLNRKVYKMCYE